MADSVLSDASISVVNAASLPISLAAIELIIAEEDTSEAFYHRHYEDPEWPGGMSGVTIMLGYDLGYATAEKVIKDLQGRVPDAMVSACLSVVGIRGTAAHDAMLRVKSRISIPFHVALDVFLHRDMPEWIGTVRKFLPNTSMLPPDCLGTLVSVAYNRGASFNNEGDRYREMRAIKADMASKNFSDIPQQLRLMSRLWPETSGVYKRRFHEAALFERGWHGNGGAMTLHDTRWVQASLNMLGELPPLEVDGGYGTKTTDAVRRFQAAYQITATGLAGSETLAKLAELVSKGVA